VTLDDVQSAALLARVLGGADPAPELLALARRLSVIPAWERRLLGVAGLVRDHGVTADRAARLAAVWELAERQVPDDRPSIGSARDALLVLHRLRGLRREEVAALLLDARHRVVAVDTVAVGTLNASRLSPRDVFGPALRRDAVAVILGHNHPSGEAAPSRADRMVTAALRSAGELLGIAVLDHIIVTRTGHFSFRESEQWG